MANWVLVADSRRARVFAIEDKHFALSEVADFAYLEGSRRGDNPTGHIFAGATGTRHGPESPTSAHEKARPLQRVSAGQPTPSRQAAPRR